MEQLRRKTLPACKATWMDLKNTTLMKGLDKSASYAMDLCETLKKENHHNRKWISYFLENGRG
jgi:hypothetical protein